MKSLKLIRKKFQYDGFEIKLEAQYGRIHEPLKNDVTVGDSIYPSTVQHEHPILFGDRSIFIESYPTEQILAEKLSAFYAHGSINTRSKDLYDIYTIVSVEKLNSVDLEKSIRRTFDQRQLTNAISEYYSRDFLAIKNSALVKDYWNEYAAKNSYAKNITFDEVIETVEDITKMVIRQEKNVREPLEKRINEAKKIADIENDSRQNKKVDKDITK